MLLEDLRKICLDLPFVTEDIKWENHLCFNVGDKMFMITSPDSVPVSISVKVHEEDFVRLCEQDGVRPAPYLARYHWIHIADLALLNKHEWTDISRKAYEMVYAKLPKKVKDALR